MADPLMHFLRRALLLLRTVALVTTMLVCTAGAASAATTTTTAPATTTTADTGGTPIQPGWNVEASVVKCPGQPSRTLTSVQTATFLQSWLPDAFYSHLKVQDPPAGVPRCTVTIPEIIQGQPQPASPVGYASNGTRVWVQAPPGKWSVAKQTQRVINSFEGHGTYVPIPTVPPTTAPGSTTTAVAKPSTSHTSSTWVWIAVPVALVALAALAALRSRRGRAEPSESAPKNAAATARRGR